MTTTPNPHDDGLLFLARTATECLVSQKPVQMSHPPGWERNGFPLPIKRQQPDQDGFVRQEYRPLAVLEYVNEVLSGEIASKKSRLRARQENGNDR